METIRNLYCVGRNYRLHAQELGNAVPTSPFLFTKPTHALVEATGQAIELPGNQGEVHHELEMVISIGKTLQAGMNPEEVIDGYALGIDFTLRDLQTELKQKGYPWLAAKGFLNSAVITAIRPFESLETLAKHEFSLLKNGEQVQHGNIQDMIFDIPTIIRFVSEHYGLGAGDLIYTGTPAGVSAVHDGDVLTLRLDEETAGEFTVRLK